MEFVLQPWHLLLTILAGLINRQQQQVIEYLRRTPSSQTGDRRPSPAHCQRKSVPGYVRLQGALANLGHKLSDTTVGNILREHGIEPAPERKRQSTWREFLEAHWDVLMDRDTKFSAAFRSILASAGVRAVRLPARSPNLNSHLERFMRSLNGECLERMIFFGERSLRTATVAFLAHYHGERNHQGLDNRLIEEDEQVGLATGQVQCRERLGGMLRCYYRAAA